MIKPIWLYLDNAVQNKIGHIDYGLYTALFSLGYLFATLTDLGINQFITKKLASEPSRIKEIYSNVFALKLIMLVVYPIIMTLAGMLLGYHHRELYFLALLCFAQAIVQLIFFFRANFQANQYFIIDSTASVMDKFILIGIVLLMLSFRIDLPLFVWGRLLSLIITVVAFYFVSVKLFGWIQPKLDTEKLIDIVQMSIPFAFITILYSINEKIDSLMIERLAPGKEQAGYYAAAYRWLDAFMMYLWTVLPIFFAKFAYNLNNTEEKQKLFNFGQIVASVPMTFVCVFIFFYGDLLFFQFKNSSPAEIAIMTKTLKILFIAGFVHGILAIYSTLLTATGHEIKVGYMIVGSIVLNIILNYIFIPKYGSIASAWVTVISTTFLSLSYMIYIHLRLQVKVPYHILLRLLIIYSAFFGTFYWLYHSGLTWYVVTAVAGISLLVYCFLGGLFRLMLSR